MKKKFLLGTSLFVLSCLPSFAQQSADVKTKTVKEFRTSLPEKGTTKIFRHGKKQFEVQGVSNNGENFTGKIKDKPRSLVSTTNKNGSVEGFILLSPEDKSAYKYSTNKQGEVVLTEVPTNQILCVQYNANGKTNAHPSSTYRSVVPSLQSLTGSPFVVYIDFDGETVTNTWWNTNYTSGQPIVAPDANYTVQQITEVWDLVAEDYRPFNINVTTDRAVYNAADPNKRMMCVFSYDWAWYTSSAIGGVAYTPSFGNEQAKVSWVFTKNMDTHINLAEAVAHEVGHTFGLNHDGRTVPAEGYYSGHNNWGPIMGLGYGREASQFSAGEYANASNLQNDLDFVAGYSGFRSDDAGNTTTTATTLVSTPSGVNAVVSAANNKKIIHNRTDVDFFSFYSGTGNLSLIVKPEAVIKTNLDIDIKLYNSANQLIATAGTGHANLLNGASINIPVQAGNYYLVVDGVGTGDVNTGWSDYGSLGGYTISGILPNVNARQYDVSAESISLTNYNGCGTQTVTPSVSIKNLGAQTITSVVAEVYVNSILKSTQTLTLSLSSNQTVSANLTDVSLLSGNNNVEVKLKNPNGQTDENVSDNNKSISANIIAGHMAQFKIAETFLNTAMNWNITNNGTTVYSNSTYTSSSNGGYRLQNFCIEEGKCYTLNVSDAFNAGGGGSSCSSYPVGNAGTIYNAGNKLVYNNILYEATTTIWNARPDTYYWWYTNLGACGGGSSYTANDYFKLIDTKTNTDLVSVLASAYTSPSTNNFCIQGAGVQYDVALNNVTLSNTLTCGVNVANGVLSIENKGSQTISSIDVDVKLNGTLVRTETFVLNLAGGSSVQKNLQSVTLSLAGNNTLEALVKINGGITDEVLSNNSKNISFNYAPGHSAKFKITQATANTSRTWFIKEAGVDVINGQNISATLNNGYLEQSFCLLEGKCYDLVVTTAFNAPGGGGGNCAGVAEWNSENTYYENDKVVYNNKLYKANWYSKNGNPELFSGQWQEWTLLGTCSGGGSYTANDYYELVDLSSNASITKVLASAYTSPKTNNFCFNAVMGAQSQSTTTSLATVSANDKITAYPNPVENQLNFSQTVENVKVFSVSGQQVFEGNNLNSVDFSAYTKGFYLVQIKNNNTFNSLTVVK